MEAMRFPCTSRPVATARACRLFVLATAGLLNYEPGAARRRLISGAGRPDRRGSCGRLFRSAPLAGKLSRSWRLRKVVNGAHPGANGLPDKRLVYSSRSMRLRRAVGEAVDAPDLRMEAISGTSPSGRTDRRIRRGAWPADPGQDALHPCSRKFESLADRQVVGRGQRSLRSDFRHDFKVSTFIKPLI